MLLLSIFGLCDGFLHACDIPPKIYVSHVVVLHVHMLPPTTFVLPVSLLRGSMLLLAIFVSPYELPLGIFPLQETYELHIIAPHALVLPPEIGRAHV